MKRVHIGAVMLLAAVLSLVACHHAPQPIPYSDVIANSTFNVTAGSWRYYTVDVTYAMLSPHLVGTFTASGGSGNDIRVFVMTDADYINWSNGHAVYPEYSSGQLTTGSFDVYLSTGSYYLVYDNSFSSVSDKSVTTTVRLNYDIQP
jgi:hypothetical protein